MNRSLIIFLSIVLLYSCSPVRGREYSKTKQTTDLKEQSTLASSTDSKKTSADKTKQSTSKSIADAEKPIFKRFSDTTYIYLGEYNPPVVAEPSKKQTSSELSDAIKMFDEGKTKIACEKITSLLEKIGKDSPDWCETMFYASECYIAKNSFEPAGKILVELLSRKDLASELKEKSLVRLGQVNCIEGNTKMAEKLFRMLKNEFPKSIYLPLANCDAVEK